MTVQNDGDDSFSWSFGFSISNINNILQKWNGDHEA